MFKDVIHPFAQVIQKDIDGTKCEPFELVDIELPDEYS